MSVQDFLIGHGIFLPILTVVSRTVVVAVVEIWIIDAIRKLRVDGTRNNMATSKPATNVLGRLRFGALSAIGPRLVPCRPEGVSSARQVADIQGVGRKEKTKRNPWLTEQWRSIVLFVCQFSSINVCPPAARTAFLSANSRGVRVFIVDLNRVTTYLPQGERTSESWTSICESIFLVKK